MWGTGWGRNVPLTQRVRGNPTGNFFFCRGDEDGEPKLEGEFPVVIPKSILQNWWNEPIQHIITNCWAIRNKMMMNQRISFHKLNNKIRSEKIIDYLISPTKHNVKVDAFE